MKAIVIEKAGGVENLLTKEVERPVLQEDEVLVATKAISINPVDYKVRAVEEVLSMIYGEDRPAVIGWDIAGTVVETGTKVTKFETGDKVFGMVNFPGAGKAYAELVASPESHLAKIPATISFEQAAASTLAALTALQVLQGKVKKNDRVLIHAASGGVGHFAIQIAKNRGAYVIGTSSAKNRDFVLSLGADEHIDYRTQKFEEILSDIDFVFDTLGGEVIENSMKVLKKGGSLTSIVAREFSETTKTMAKELDANLAFELVQSNGDDMKTLANLMESGAIKAHVSKTFLFDEIDKAHLALESGRTVGKVVVTV